jgi:hypothetical protein
MNRQSIIVGLVILLVGCSDSKERYEGKGGPMSEKRTIEQVQEAYTDEWMKISGVQGTGIGLSKDKPCIKVFSSVPVEELKDKIPSFVEGYPVIIEETGTFRALEKQ